MTDLFVSTPLRCGLAALANASLAAIQVTGTFDFATNASAAFTPSMDVNAITVCDAAAWLAQTRRFRALIGVAVGASAATQGPVARLLQVPSSSSSPTPPHRSSGFFVSVAILVPPNASVPDEETGPDNGRAIPIISREQSTGLAIAAIVDAQRTMLSSDLAPFVAALAQAESFASVALVRVSLGALTVALPSLRPPSPSNSAPPSAPALLPDEEAAVDLVVPLVAASLFVLGTAGALRRWRQVHRMRVAALEWTRHAGSKEGPRPESARRSGLFIREPRKGLFLREPRRRVVPAVPKAEVTAAPAQMAATPMFVFRCDADGSFSYCRPVGLGSGLQGAVKVAGAFRRTEIPAIDVDVDIDVGIAAESPLSCRRSLSEPPLPSPRSSMPPPQSPRSRPPSCSPLPATRRVVWTRPTVSPSPLECKPRALIIQRLPARS